MIRKRIWFGLAAVLSLAIAWTPILGASQQSAASPTAGNLVFILDASGSMWGQVGGKAKIAIAKEVMTRLVQDLPDDAAVGLVAYGHRRKGDCNDVQELAALAPVDKTGLIKIIQGLNAIGMTPISRSVRLTAERIKTLEEETAIILVSDGKETCDPAPCALVKELKASGFKFVMHVIGFDVTQEERAQLECLAQAGGGQYYAASNAGELLIAAQELVKKSTPPYGILKVMVSKNGKPFSAGITLAHEESGKRWTPASSSGKTGIAEIRLTPGTYQAEIKDIGVSGGRTPVVKLKDITITEGETVERSADFSDGLIRLTTLRNGTPHGASVFYFRQGEAKHFHSEGTHAKTGRLERKLLPGTYTVKITDGGIAGKPTVVFEDLEIAPGVAVEKTAEFAAGELTVTATIEGKPFATPVEITDAQGKAIFKNWTNWPKTGTRIVWLPAGTYAVTVTNSKDNRQKDRFDAVEMAAGQSKTLSSEFPLAP